MNKRLNQILQSFEADVRAMAELCVTSLRRELEQEDSWYQRTLRRKMAEERVGAPAHSPVTAPCIICGAPAHTYRWGQCTSMWSSETGIKATHATVKWQDFDTSRDAAWMPLCSHHARILDTYDNVTKRQLGHYCG